MAVFTIPTTAEISQASFSPPVGLATGDLIVTKGYYAAGDGGAAEFTVKTGTADNYFSHPINGCTGWIADLVIRDGVVNVDLGAGNVKDGNIVPGGGGLGLASVDDVVGRRRDRGRLFGVGSQTAKSFYVYH